MAVAVVLVLASFNFLSGATTVETLETLLIRILGSGIFSLHSFDVHEHFYCELLFQPLKRYSDLGNDCSLVVVVAVEGLQVQVATHSPQTLSEVVAPEGRADEADLAQQPLHRIHRHAEQPLLKVPRRDDCPLHPSDLVAVEDGHGLHCIYFSLPLTHYIFTTSEGAYLLYVCTM